VFLLKKGGDSSRLKKKVLTPKKKVYFVSKTLFYKMQKHAPPSGTAPRAIKFYIKKSLFVPTIPKGIIRSLERKTPKTLTLS